MAKRAKPEEIIAKLREVEVRLSQGESVGMAAKSIGVKFIYQDKWQQVVSCKSYQFMLASMS